MDNEEVRPVDPEMEISVGSPGEDIKHLGTLLNMLDSEGCRQTSAHRSSLERTQGGLPHSLGHGYSFILAS